VILIQESSGSVTFAVKVHPRAKRDAITGELGGALKVSLTSPPIEGRANDACIEFLAKLLKVPRSSVTIASGQSGRNKVVRIQEPHGQLNTFHLTKRAPLDHGERREQSARARRGVQGASLELFRTLAGNTHRVRAAVLGRQYQRAF
jgi:uncharacterized protein (TIGR00251 family)